MATDDPWRSERLIYRSTEPDSAEDKAFFAALKSKARNFMNVTGRLPRPQNARDVDGHLKALAEDTLMAVVICLPSDDPAGKPTPIGEMDLNPPMSHHRSAQIGISILPAYQNQGYGSEAIRWIVDWGFRYAGLNHIAIGVFEYNTGALRLYERLGFKLEGRLREEFFHDGRFWDDIRLGMLAREWPAIKASLGQRAEHSGKEPEQKVLTITTS